MSDEFADRSGKPHRYYFDDLADSEEFAEPAGDLVDTGPIQVIRDPLPGSAAGEQLYFDDIDPEPESMQDDEPDPIYAPAAPLGDEPPKRGILAGSGRRPRPIGAILAVVAVLALVGVIAAVGGQGHKGSKTKHSGGTHTNAALSTLRPSDATSAPSTQPTDRTSSSAAPTKTSARHSGAATKTPTNIPLTVLNNTIRSGLAAQAAHAFAARGWHVGPPGNYTGNLSTTTVYYSPNDPAQHRAAETLAAQFPHVAQVQPRFAGLPGTGLTVVLAPDWP